MLQSCRLWLHGPAARSQSVLAVLLRIRHQYHRPPQQMAVTMMSSTRDGPRAGLQERQQLVDEAMRILRKEVRGGETLSDVDATAASFCVEVGKLLSVAAAFGAATTTPRVAEAIQWVRGNKKQLTSARQVMSICIPLLNLKDGRTAGRQFVMEELSAQLLEALGTPVSAGVSSELELKQHRSAIISVFLLIGRLLETDSRSSLNGSSGSGADEGSIPDFLSPEEYMILCQKTSLLFTKGVDALFMLVEKALPPLEISDCVHILQAYQRLENCSKKQKMEKEEVDVKLSMNRVRQLIDAALGGPSATGTTGRPSDVCHLLSVASKLQETKHMVELSRAVLLLLPLALASATVKDMCMALQVLVRLRGNAPEVITDPSMIKRVFEAVRPRLFLIAEANPGSLRHFECSLLMSSISRLEVEVADDLVNLLCSCFTASMELVQAAQLIPFLQGLSRYSESISRSLGDSQAAVYWESSRLSSVLPCIDQAADRVIAWSSACKLTSLESAQLLLVFSQLRYMRVIAVYIALEEKLAAAVDRLSTGLYNADRSYDVTVESCNIDGDGEEDVTFAADESNEGIQEATGKLFTGTNATSLTSVLMNALDVFRSEAITVSKEEEASLQRAEKLYASLRKGAIKSIIQVDNPKSLVMLLNLLMPEMKKGGGGDAPSRNEESVGFGTASSSSAQTFEDDAVASAVSAAAKVCLVAHVANAYEVGALGRATGELLSRGFIGKAEAQKGMDALLERSESVELSLYDMQSLLEGMRRLRVRSIPPSFLYRIASLLKSSPKKTTMILRRLLPVLKNMTPKPGMLDVFMKLTEVSMENACVLTSASASSSSSPLPLRDTVLLAYALAQLYELSSKMLLVNTTGKEVTGMNEESEMEERKEQEQREGEEKGGGGEEEQQEEEGSNTHGDGEEDISADDGTVKDGLNETRRHLVEITKKTFLSLGDVACSLLQQRDNADSVNDKRDTLVSPQEVVMIVQSFEKVSVRHHALLYELVPLARDMSGAMEPLELSLLLNAFARLGAWNGRVLNTLANNVATKAHTCSLKQCQSILQALQSSGFLRPEVFLSTPEYKASLGEDWRPVCAPTTQTTVEPLVALATSVVERMATLIERPKAVSALLESVSLEDIAGVTRVLGFFDQPPQPTFDTYFETAVRKLVLVREEHLMSECTPRQERNWLMILLSLKGYLGKLRQYNRQCACAQAMSRCLISLDEEKLNSLKAGICMMPEEKVTELYYTCSLFALLYNVKFSSEDSLGLLHLISEKLQEEDLCQNPRRVSSALRHLTKISCKHIGNPNALYKIILKAADRLVAGLQDSEVGETNDKSSSSPVCSLSASVMMLEVLCTSYLFSLPDSEEEGKEKLVQLLFFFLPQLLRNGVSKLSTAESSVFLLVVAVAGAAVPGDLTGYYQVSKACLEEVHHTILLKERQLSVHDAVNILLSVAVYPDGDVVQADIVQCASQVLVSQMGKTDSTGLWLLPELYRLVTAGDACFMSWCTRLRESVGEGGAASFSRADDSVLEVCERVLPALLRATQSALKNSTPTLSWQCLADVAEQYQRYAATTVGREGDDAGLAGVLATIVLEHQQEEEEPEE